MLHFNNFWFNSIVIDSAENSWNIGPKLQHVYKLCTKMYFFKGLTFVNYNRIYMSLNHIQHFLHVIKPYSTFLVFQPALHTVYGPCSLLLVPFQSLHYCLSSDSEMAALPFFNPGGFAYATRGGVAMCGWPLLLPTFGLLSFSFPFFASEAEISFSLIFWHS